MGAPADLVRKWDTSGVSNWSSATVQWPFVGRDELVTLLRSLWLGELSRGVLIHGPAGIGKTRLADEFAISLGIDAAVLRCVGSPATQSTPYAAIAHLIPVDVVSSADRPRQVLDAVRTQLSTGRRILVADDIAFLDEASLSLFGHLLALGELFLLGTVRVGHPIPPGLDSLIRSYGLHHMTVEALDDRAVTAAAAEVVGAPLEPLSAQRLIDITAGNPLYLRELLLQSVAAQAVTILPSGQARLELSVTAAPRLVELVGNRLAAVPESLLPLLHLVAVAEPLTAADVERAGFTDDAVRLEQQGWLRVDGRGRSPEIRLAHPLHSEVLRSTMGALEYRRQVARAAEILRTRPEPERDDPLRIALWELDAGLQPSAAVLLDGARRARAAVDLASARRLVEASYRIEPTQAAQHIWLEVLFLLSQFEEAERVGNLSFEGAPDLSLTVSSMMLRMDNLLWGVGDPERAYELVQSYRPEFARIGIEFLLAVPEAFIHGVDGQSALALELLGPVPDDPGLFLVSSLAHINARAGRGSFGEVEQLCQRGLDILHAMPDPRASMDPIFFRLNRGMARNHSGRSAEVYAEFVLAYGMVVEERQSFLRCFVGFVTGQAALNLGFLESADQWFAETDAATGELSLPTARRIAVAGRAAVAGQRGDRAGAAKHLAQLDALPPDVAFMRVETQAGRSWAQHCLGRPAEAREGMRAVTEWAIAADEPVSALLGLTEACRLSDERWAAEQLPRIAGLDAVEGPLPAARVLFVNACASRTGAELLEAASACAAVDVHLLAAEAATLALHAFERVGDRRGASAARTLAATELAACDGADTPALRVVASLVSPLSSRETEVARLAALGFTSKEIAERLYLSSRTVENHLQRVYTKLGVNGRDDLPGRLT